MNETVSQLQGTGLSQAGTVAADMPKACPVKNTWLRRIGFVGFMFFLVKGLLWLAALVVTAMVGLCTAQNTTGVVAP
ncbi:MAG TPA: hypothetical protein VG797_06070 [Phycisphaerales bacterium]|nr:hypothetical protein [Phycisphaerales bacterium]